MHAKPVPHTLQSIYHVDSYKIIGFIGLVPKQLFDDEHAWSGNEVVLSFMQVEIPSQQAGDILYSLLVSTELSQSSETSFILYVYIAAHFRNTALKVPL